MPRLTKQVVDQTPYPSAGQVFVQDAELPGFGLQVTKRRKSFILEKRIRGQMRRLTNGPDGPLTVEQARRMAEVSVGAIARGEDPAQVRQDRIHEPTVADLAEQYLVRHAPRKRTAREDRSILEIHLKGFRTCKRTAITRNEIARLHGKTGETTPYRARDPGLPTNFKHRNTQRPDVLFHHKEFAGHVPHCSSQEALKPPMALVYVN